ncbi:hypothetical protein [Streptomyces luteolus]|uniref:Secreted protein n=1 Tax=Streptomyces luteolus TaxID=3043615 RepID=A0ABT6SPW2_9ACTN|nr:hypothetical protein [Streptomyces sp. B-S-A12]MDI3417652.1 hypothetical protein [Streptomyces sp. B-S-A12]
MRLRNTLAAAGGALALTAVLTAPAHAATGDFSYSYLGADGARHSATLHDPENGRCHTLPEVDSPATPPAFAPHNSTDAYAKVFTEYNCGGSSWTLRPHGRPATDRLTLRSVIFLRA